jgi:hypothetical protein
MSCSSIEVLTQSSTNYRQEFATKICDSQVVSNLISLKKQIEIVFHLVIGIPANPYKDFSALLFPVIPVHRAGFIICIVVMEQCLEVFVKKSFPFFWIKGKHIRYSVTSPLRPSA